MSYTKQNFVSGQVLKADHLNHMEDGIEAISSGVTIKKAVFTDRESVYEFLLQNYDKIIYIGCQMKGYPRVKFIPQTMCYGTGTNNFTIEGFPLVEINMFICDDNESNIPTLAPSCIYINENTTRYLFDPKIGIDSSDVTVAVSRSVQEMPDVYWSAMNVEMTAYYFSE